MLLSFGASVVGPGHQRDGLPNQDAWGHRAVSGGRLVVAADGLGSAPNAREGARAACRAVPDAMRLWLRRGGASDTVLPALIHVIWRAELGEVPPETASTTCLFAYLRPDGSGILGMLGDGLILSAEPSGLRTFGDREQDSFSNQTAALGITRRVLAWELCRLSAGEKTVVLCTDGVSDDLLPGRHSEFVEWLETEIAPLAPGRRWRALATALRDWPTPHHIDDKTIAVLRRTS